MYRKNVLPDARNNTCTASGSSVTLSLAQESTPSSSISSSTNTAVDTIPSPNSYSWSPALYQHGNYYKIKIIYFV